MNYIDQIRRFLPSIEQDDKASVYVSVQHLREIVDFADNAQSFANDATALLEKAETERKTQDILIAEMTRKIEMLEKRLTHCSDNVREWQALGQEIAGRSPYSNGQPTREIVKLHIEGLEQVVKLLEQSNEMFKEDAARMRPVLRALLPYQSHEGQLGNIARVANDILNPEE